MKFEFYHVDAMEAVHYEPIWRELIGAGIDARMVAVPGVRNTASSGWFDFETVAEYYNARGIPFNETSDPSAHAITTQNSYILREYRGLRFRLMYGPSVYPAAWGVSRQAAKGFDVVLVHGRRYAEIIAGFNSVSDIRIVGYPRYDDYFSHRIDGAALMDGWVIDRQKPVILYLPTWGENSSFDVFFESIGELTDNFNVIVKPHHCTLRFEPLRMERINSSSVLCVRPSSTLPALFAISDLVISDSRSAALCEALLVGRPALAVLPSEIDISWVEQSRFADLVTVCSNPEKLRSAVAEAFTTDPLSPERCAWRDANVSFRNGESAAHAASEIIAAANAHSSFLDKTARTCRWLRQLPMSWKGY